MHVAQPGDHIMSLLEINNHIPDKTIHSIWKSQDETFHPSLPPDETTCGNITILSATAPLVTSMMLKLRWAFFRNHHHSHHYQHRYHHRYYYDHWSLIKQVENAKCAQFRALEQKRKNAEVESSHYINSIFLKMTARQARLRGTLVWRETGRRSTAWNRCTGLDQGGDGEIPMVYTFDHNLLDLWYILDLLYTSLMILVSSLAREMKIFRVDTVLKNIVEEGFNAACQVGWWWSSWWGCRWLWW